MTDKPIEVDVEFEDAYWDWQYAREHEPWNAQLKQEEYHKVKERVFRLIYGDKR